LAQKLDKSQIYYEVEKLRIPYEINNEVHIYIPDFYIPSLNLIIETKNRYFYKRDYKRIKLQQQVIINLGYLYTILLNAQDINNFKILK